MEPELSPEDKVRIRKQIEEGVASLKRGEGVDGEAFFAKLFARLEELEEKGKASTQK